MKKRRILKDILPYILDVLQNAKVEMTTSEIKEVLWRGYGIELSTKDVWNLLEKAVNEDAHIVKTQGGRRPTYEWRD